MNINISNFNILEKKEFDKFFNTPLFITNVVKKITTNPSKYSFVIFGIYKGLVFHPTKLFHFGINIAENIKARPK